MKKIYLLVATLLLTVAFTKATILNIFNDTGKTIIVIVGDYGIGTMVKGQLLGKYTTRSRPVTIKNKKRHQFIGWEILGNPIHLKFVGEREFDYFRHSYYAITGAINSIIIKRPNKTGKPKIIQTFPLIWFKQKDYGPFEINHSPKDNWPRRFL